MAWSATSFAASRYLVNNTTTLVADVAGFITEYRPVYNRSLEVYKGIDNTLQFRLLNADQKGINLSAGYTVKFCAYDETDRLIVEKDATIQDDGSTLSRGKFKVNITENELKNIADVLQENSHVNVMSDDIYEHLLYDNFSFNNINATRFKR